MQLMLTGKPITVGKGRKIGLVDRITDADGWRDAARKLIASRARETDSAAAGATPEPAIARPFIRNVLIKQVAAKARKDHYPAPYAMIDLWARHGASTRTGYEAEARSFAELMCTSTSRNLVRVFFLQNKLKGQGGKSATKIRMCTSSAPASWVATLRPGARFAASP